MNRADLQPKTLLNKRSFELYYKRMGMFCGFAVNLTST